MASLAIRVEAPDSRRVAFRWVQSVVSDAGQEGGVPMGGRRGGGELVTPASARRVAFQQKIS